MAQRLLVGGIASATCGAVGALLGYFLGHPVLGLVVGATVGEGLALVLLNRARGRP